MKLKAPRLSNMIILGGILTAGWWALDVMGEPVPTTPAEAIALVDRIGERFGVDLIHNEPLRYEAAGRSPDIFDGDRARRELETIMVNDEFRLGYVRDDWPHWEDMNANCRDSRDDVLAAESLDDPRLSENGCDVVGGRWLDVFTGETFTDPSDLDIDHLVPLAEAYRSGGYRWSEAVRKAYANDVTDPRTLIAVSASANRSKGDKGPEEWLPPRQGEICRYVADWIAVKARWKLTMDERERVTVGNILDACVQAAGASS